MATVKASRTFISLSMLLMVWLPLKALADVPFTPGQFRYTIYSDSTVELFWSRTSNAPVMGYEISRNGEIQGVFDALSLLDSTLVPGTTYTFSITAVGYDGERSGESTVTLLTPQSADTIATLQRQISALEAEKQALETQINEGFLAPVQQTGQRVSVRFGDDGDHQAGIPWPDPRFIRNVNESDDLNENDLCDGTETCNGTITDQLTGLVWLQNANCFGSGNWSDAIDSANALAGDGTSGCGLSDNSQAGDWRLPNVMEMQSIMDYGHSFPTALLPTGHPFTDVQLGGIVGLPDRYWTSTITLPGESGAYSVSVSVGWVDRLSTLGDTYQNYVWPVRNRQ